MKPDFDALWDANAADRELIPVLVLALELAAADRPVKGREVVERSGWSSATLKRRVAEARHLGIPVRSSGRGYELAAAGWNVELVRRWLYLEWAAERGEPVAAE